MLRGTSQSGYFSSFELLQGWDFSEDFEDKINDQLIKIIDYALIEVFGYPSFILLMGNMMVYSEKGVNKVNYVVHSKKYTSSQYSEFGIAPLHFNWVQDISGKFLGAGLRDGFKSSERIFASFLINGYSHFFTGENRRIDNVIGQSSYFVENYYNIYRPITTSDYIKAYRAFLKTPYMGFKSQENIDKLNTKQRGLIYKFLCQQLDDTLDFIFSDLPYSGWTYHFDGYKEENSLRTEKLAKTLLRRIVDRPFDDKNDLVKQLSEILQSGKDGALTLQSSDTQFAENNLINLGISINIPYEKLAHLAPKIITTLGFEYNSKLTSDGAYTSRDILSDNYRLVFEEFWQDNEQFQAKIINTHKQWVDILENQDLIDQYDKKPWKITVFRETGSGIPIKGKIGDSTEFQRSEIIINDPSSSTDIHFGIGSLIANLLVVPRGFFIVYHGTTPLLFGDLCNIHSLEYVLSSSASRPVKPTRLFPWKQDVGLTREIYDSYVSASRNKEKYLSEEDLRYFNSFSSLRDRNIGINSLIFSEVYKSLRNYIWDDLHRKDPSFNIPTHLDDLHN